MEKIDCVHRKYCSLNCKKDNLELRCILKNTDLNKLPLYLLIKKQCERLNIKYS